MGGIAGDPYESKQDLGELNRWTLIGCTEQRGDAWHKMPGLQGVEDNHYPGHIPPADVLRRLFNWEPRRAKVAYLVPILDLQSYDDYSQAQTVTIDGARFKVVETQEGRHGVLRNDNDYDLGVFKSGAMHPPYQVTLMREAERLVGQTLGISTAGLLQKGGVAWVEYSMHEALHDPLSGLEYRPNLLRADSMNGNIALTTALTIEATVCMNTLTRNLLEAKQAGAITRRKHTQSIASRSLDDERAALGIVEQVDHEFLADLHTLIKREVTEKQRIEVMDIMVPLNDEMGERAQKFATEKRDELQALSLDPRVEPWLGTAFGEFQRYNTFSHWKPAPTNTSKGTTVYERNTWKVISGERAKEDRTVIAAMDMVLA